MREAPLLSEADLERAAPIVARSARTYANLALRRDKALLFSPQGHAFLMYGRHGRSRIAMGDPIGPPDEARELVRRFHEECVRARRWSVFFEVGPQHLDWYFELGLALTQLGEEARVDLAAFDLERAAHGRLRQTRAKLVRAGYRFEVLPREAVPPVLPDLEKVSRSWLRGRPTGEKGFSNASFDERYLACFPAAVVRNDDGIVAFANLWQGAGREELSVDLMRYQAAAPHGTMDFLFTGLMEWGRAQGYRWFNFGMAPLSGLDTRGKAPLWNHVGTFVYQHGEPFYHFRGLRSYKEKFHPVWTPLYLASPGGLAIPAALVDTAALVAGGLARVVTPA